MAIMYFLRLYAYPNLQLCLILMSGCMAAITTYILSSPAVLFLLVCALSSYCFINYLCYHPQGEKWRTKITEILISCSSYYFKVKTSKAHQQVNPVRTSKGQLVHYETQKMIELIARDFIMTWYQNVSHDKQLPQDVVQLLQHLSLELNIRLRNIDIRQLVLHIIPLVDPFLTTLNEVGHINERGKLSFDVNHPYCVMLLEKKPNVTHPALKNEISEIEYIEKMVDTFLQSSIPPQYKKCDIALQFVREVLVHRVFIPVINLLCDSDFLLEAIPLVLAKASKEKVQIIMNSIRNENLQLEENLSHPDGLLSVILPPKYKPVSWTDEQTVPFQFVTRETNLLSPVRLETDGQAIEDLVFVTFPSIYVNRHVRVDTTDGIHVGYIVKFPKALLQEDDIKMLNIPSDILELEALKRYSDFVKFHKSLMKSDLSIHMKGISLPDKKVLSSILNKVSSTEPDPTLILERKEGLGKYLQSLSVVNEIKESKVFKEFLVSGVEVLQNANTFSQNQKETQKLEKIRVTEEPNIKASPPITTVLDTFLEMQMLLPCHTLLSSYTSSTKRHASDKLSSHEELIHDRSTTSKQESVRNTEYVDYDGQTPLQKVYSIALQYVVKFYRLLLDILMSSISRDTIHISNEHLSQERNRDSPLFNSLLCLVNEATRTTIPELWLTSESTQLALLGVCGGGIDSILWKQLNEVVYDETRWARLLYSLRHTLWPQGKLQISRRKSLKEEEKEVLRNEAVLEIKRFLPNLLPVIIGSQGYDDTINHCLDCIQNPKINRHFLYHMIDMLCTGIIPEFHDRDFQRKLFKLRSKPIFTTKNSQ